MFPKRYLFLALLAMFTCSIQTMEPEKNKQSADNSQASEFAQPDKKQKTDRMIILRGSDNTEIRVPESVARLSRTIDEIIATAEKQRESIENGIPFNNITGNQLQQIMPLLKHAVSTFGLYQVRNQLAEKQTSELATISWFSILKRSIEFYKHSLSPEKFQQLIQALQFLDLNVILTVIDKVDYEHQYGLPAIVNTSAQYEIARGLMSQELAQWMTSHCLESITSSNTPSIIDYATNKNTFLGSSPNVSLDGTYSIVDSPREIAIANLNTGVHYFLQTPTGLAVRQCFAWSPYSNYCALPYYEPKTKRAFIKIVGSPDFSIVADNEVEKGLVMSTIWSSDGQYLMIGIQSNKNIKIVVTHAPEFNNYTTVLNISGSIHALACSPKNRFLAVGLSNGTVEIYDTETKNIICTLPNYITPSGKEDVFHHSTIKWSPDGTLFAMRRNNANTYTLNTEYSYWNFIKLLQIKQYWDNEITPEESVLIEAIRTRALHQNPYIMGPDSQHIFDKVAQKNPAAREIIHNILRPYITKYEQ